MLAAAAFAAMLAFAPGRCRVQQPAHAVTMQAKGFGKGAPPPPPPTKKAVPRNMAVRGPPLPTMSPEAKARGEAFDALADGEQLQRRA